MLAEWLLQPEKSGHAVESSLAVEGQFVLSTEWCTPGSGATQELRRRRRGRVPGTRRWRGLPGTLWRERQARLQPGGSWLPSGSGSMVVDSAGFWEARASWLVKGCGGRKGAGRTSSISGESLSSGHHLSSHSSRVEGSCISEEVTAGAESPLEFSLLVGGGERPPWWGSLLFGLFNPS